MTQWGDPIIGVGSTMAFGAEMRQSGKEEDVSTSKGREVCWWCRGLNWPQPTTEEEEEEAKLRLHVQGQTTNNNCYLLRGICLPVVQPFLTRKEFQWWWLWFLAMGSLILSLFRCFWKCIFHSSLFEVAGSPAWERPFEMKNSCWYFLISARLTIMLSHFEGGGGWLLGEQQVGDGC